VTFVFAGSPLATPGSKATFEIHFLAIVATSLRLRRAHLHRFGSARRRAAAIAFWSKLAELRVTK
jgi:hypothetical protein